MNLKLSMSSSFLGCLQLHHLSHMFNCPQQLTLEPSNKIIVLTEFVFHLKILSAVCTDDAHKDGRLFRGGSIYLFIDIYFGAS